jgi:hypothetical protein
VPSERIQANKPRAPSRSSGALCAPSGGRLRRGGRRANRTVERSVPRSATRPGRSINRRRRWRAPLSAMPNAAPWLRARRTTRCLCRNGLGSRPGHAA